MKKLKKRREKSKKSRDRRLTRRKEKDRMPRIERKKRKRGKRRKESRRDCKIENAGLLKRRKRLSFKKRLLNLLLLRSNPRKKQRLRRSQRPSMLRRRLRLKLRIWRLPSRRSPSRRRRRERRRRRNSLRSSKSTSRTHIQFSQRCSCPTWLACSSYLPCRCLQWAKVSRTDSLHR